MPAGRPKKEIDKDQFENLLRFQCTEIEIAGFFHCDVDTINAWCKRTYEGLNFSDVQKIYSASGKCSLRRWQFKQAEKSSRMAIFLGKQYLGQTERIEANVASENKDLLKDYLNKIKE